jgi:arsenite methyltransferase
MKDEEIHKVVRGRYAGKVKEQPSCAETPSCCCGGSTLAENISKQIGYSEEDLSAVPEGANLGLGCGNPVALASLKEGDVVLDLGSGAGFDCFLAANKVGATGRVIGVDMTPEMLDRARENARKDKYENVEFRLGEIEHLPVADNSVDVVISNCVINLSPNKPAVFGETFRALKPGGRLMVSDIVLLEELPDFVKESIDAYVGCVSGASLKDDYLKAISDAGFQDISVIGEAGFGVDLLLNDPTIKSMVDALGAPMEEVKKVAEAVVSIKVRAVKP